jgi:membrane associated rhomboid family serine protease
MQRLRRYRVTLALAAFMLGWYGFQSAVYGRWSPARLRWLFTVESLGHPTPGWLFSTFSHGFTDPLGHLLPNVGMLVLFGGLAESHLREWEYVAFVVVVGSLASLTSVGIDPTRAPILGSSGAIYGLVTYATLHIVRHHPDRLSLNGGDEPTLLRAASRSTFTVVVLVLPVAVFCQVAVQVAGLLPSGHSAILAHAVGASLGLLYEYAQPVVGRPCGSAGAGSRTQ